MIKNYASKKICHTLWLFVMWKVMYYLRQKEEAVITMSKADIACYSETTEETIVMVLLFFKEQGILKTQGRKVMIKNKKLLEIIAEGF